MKSGGQEKSNWIRYVRCTEKQKGNLQQKFEEEMIKKRRRITEGRELGKEWEDQGNWRDMEEAIKEAMNGNMEKKERKKKKETMSEKTKEIIEKREKQRQKWRLKNSQN